MHGIARSCCFEMRSLKTTGTAKLTVHNRWNRPVKTYKRHRFPPDIIGYAVWLCYRFTLSHQDIEDVLADSVHSADSCQDPTHTLPRFCREVGSVGHRWRTRTRAGDNWSATGERLSPFVQ